MHVQLRGVEMRTPARRPARLAGHSSTAHASLRAGQGDGLSARAGDDRGGELHDAGRGDALGRGAELGPRGAGQRPRGRPASDPRRPRARHSPVLVRRGAVASPSPCTVRPLFFRERRDRREASGYAPARAAERAARAEQEQADLAEYERVRAAQERAAQERAAQEQERARAAAGGMAAAREAAARRARGQGDGRRWGRADDRRRGLHRKGCRRPSFARRLSRCADLPRRRVSNNCAYWGYNYCAANPTRGYLVDAAWLNPSQCKDP